MWANESSESSEPMKVCHWREILKLAMCAQSFASGFLFHSTLYYGNFLENQTLCLIGTNDEILNTGLKKVRDLESCMSVFWFCSLLGADRNYKVSKRQEMPAESITRTRVKNDLTLRSVVRHGMWTSCKRTRRSCNQMCDHRQHRCFPRLQPERKDIFIKGKINNLKLILW